MTIQTSKEVAEQHKQADLACGREWNSDDGCACGACRIVRAAAMLGKLGGSQKSAAKTAAARKNARKPRK